MHLQLPVDKIIRRNATKLSSLVAHLARGQLALALSSGRALKRRLALPKSAEPKPNKSTGRSLVGQIFLFVVWSFFFA